MIERAPDIHRDVDVKPIGDQLFLITDRAWQGSLADTGDLFDRRYNGLGRIGLAILTSTDRPPRPLGLDNPLCMIFNSTVPHLAMRGTLDKGMLKYRYNQADTDAVFDPSPLGVRSLDQIPKSILEHKRYPTNGAAKRFLLLNRSSLLSSYNEDGLNTGIFGTIGAAGGIRLLNKRGIVAVSGGNQIHDHLLAMHWAWMGEGIIDRNIVELTSLETEVLAVAVQDSMKAAIEHIEAYTRRTFHKRLDELQHSDYKNVLQEASSFLLSEAA